MVIRRNMIILCSLVRSWLSASRNDATSPHEILSDNLFITCLFYFLAHIIVLPQTQQIKVDPSDVLNEESSNFSLVCEIYAKSSYNIEFLFRTWQSDNFKSVANISSKARSQFNWIAILHRKTSRESGGEYSCRSFSEDNYTSSIAVNINCMINLNASKLN